jgi:hypothetical protein
MKKTSGFRRDLSLFFNCKWSFGDPSKVFRRRLNGGRGGGATR